MNDSSEHIGQTYEAEVIMRDPVVGNGDTVWQAQIDVPQGTALTHEGKQRFFTVRGPPRKTREQADDDAQRLTEVSSRGPKAVRTLANQLFRSKEG